jgi:hypothetical protein
MTDIRLDPIVHPAAWRADEIDSLDRISFDLEERHLAALEGALGRAKQAGKALADITDDDFALPEIADDLADLRDLLLHGRGLLLVRGWPVERLSVDDIGMMYWGLGTHFGRGVPQSAMGDRLGYVTDVATQGKHERGYRSKAELSLHNDSDDIVGLLCIRQGKSGGLSRLASAMTIHNIMAAECPHLLAPLYDGFYHSWTDARPPGEGPVTSLKVPLFSWTDGEFAVCHLRARVELACEETGTKLTALQVEALDAFEEIANRPGVLFEFRLEPGTASFINNYTVLHSRTGFEDFDEPERKRLLLRLWLQARPARPVDPGIRLYYGQDGAHVDGRTDTAYVPERPSATGAN